LRLGENRRLNKEDRFSQRRKDGAIYVKIDSIEKDRRFAIEEM